MLNDLQMDAINAKRRAAGRRPITTQILRQMPNLPAGTDVSRFWEEYKMPGDIDPQPGQPISEYVDPAAFASGVDGKVHQGDAPEQPPVLGEPGDSQPPGQQTGDPNVKPETDYNDMTVDELKAEAEKRELDTTGTKLKADWVSLLENDDKAKATKV